MMVIKIKILKARTVVQKYIYIVFKLVIFWELFYCHNDYGWCFLFLLLWILASKDKTILCVSL